MRRYAVLVVLLSLFAAIKATGQQQGAAGGDAVVLITIDGARTEEIFGGLDVDVLKSTLKEGQRVEDTASYRRFWAASREDRRQKLLPFFWSLVTAHGSIAGDSSSGSPVRLGNRHWFSYPGYAEILLGEPHDEAIKSNDPTRNPYTTVLEMLRQELKLPKERVATFASWGVFNEIAEHREGATFVNAGVEALPATDDERTPSQRTSGAGGHPVGEHALRCIHVRPGDETPCGRTAPSSLPRAWRDR